jgi:hypothetical protein
MKSQRPMSAFAVAFRGKAGMTFSARMSACDPKRTSMLKAFTSAFDAAVVSWPGATVDYTYLSRFFDRCAKVAGNLRGQHGFPLALEIAIAALTSIRAECLYFATESWRHIKKLYPGPSGEDADAGRPTSRCRISYPAPTRAGIGRHRGAKHVIVPGRLI